MIKTWVLIILFFPLSVHLKFSSYKEETTTKTNSQCLLAKRKRHFDMQVPKIRVKSRQMGYKFYLNFFQGLLQMTIFSSKSAFITSETFTGILMIFNTFKPHLPLLYHLALTFLLSSSMYTFTCGSGFSAAFVFH